MVARVGDQLGVFDDVRAVVEALGAKLGEGRTDVIDRADLVNVEPGQEAFLVLVRRPADLDRIARDSR